MPTRKASKTSRKKARNKKKPRAQGCGCEKWIPESSAIQHMLLPVKKAYHQFNSMDINTCKLGLPDLRIYKVLSSEEKGSASSSVITFANLSVKCLHEDLDVAVKLSFARKQARDEDDSLEAERDFYEHLVPSLLVHTPHLMLYIGTFECKSFRRQLKLMKTPVARSLMKYMNDLKSDESLTSQFKLDHAYFLLTKKSGGKFLSEWIQRDYKKMRSDERILFINSVLTQIAYTLEVFRVVGFMHNDLHTGNVFVEKLEKPFAYNLQIGVSADKFVKIVTPYFCRIYDFDHSSKSATVANKYVRTNKLLKNFLCSQAGECDKYTAKGDWFTLLEFLKYDFDNTAGVKLSRIVANQLPIELLNKLYVIGRDDDDKDDDDDGDDDDDDDEQNLDKTGWLAFGGHSCICDDKFCSTCTRAHTLLAQTSSPTTYMANQSSFPVVPQNKLALESLTYRLPDAAAVTRGAAATGMKCAIQ